MQEKDQDQQLPGESSIDEVEMEKKGLDKANEKIKPVEKENLVSLQEEIDRLKDSCQQVLSAKDEMEDLLKRQKAEFDNYRKRVQEEKVDLLRYGGEEFLKSFLSILDSYEKAIDIESDSKEVSSFLEGFKLLKKKIDELLLQNGVKLSTQKNDLFDPSLHKAVQFEEKEEVEERVVQIFQKGYFLHEKVLREAMVKVTKRKELQKNVSNQENEEKEINKIEQNIKKK